VLRFEPVATEFTTGVKVTASSEVAFDKKFCSDASEERAASLFRATEFVYCCFWNG
jgi:hypothetical protein